MSNFYIILQPFFSLNLYGLVLAGALAVVYITLAFKASDLTNRIIGKL